MVPRSSFATRSVSLVLAAVLAGVPSLAAADPPAPLLPSTPTPIADAARAAALQRYGYRGRNRHDAMKWTGFGLTVAGASLVAVGAVLEDDDCFDNDISRGDCRDIRKGAFLAGGIMAGTGIGLLIMSADRGGRRRGRGRYPDVTMRGGRMVVQQRIRF
jgi:hypothetical protein